MTRNTGKGTSIDPFPLFMIFMVKALIVPLAPLAT